MDEERRGQQQQEQEEKEEKAAAAAGAVTVAGARHAHVRNMNGTMACIRIMCEVFAAQSKYIRQQQGTMTYAATRAMHGSVEIMQYWNKKMIHSSNSGVLPRTLAASLDHQQSSGKGKRASVASTEKNIAMESMKAPGWRKRKVKIPRKHTAREWWDGVVPPWSSAKVIGRRELRGEQDGAESLGLDKFYHMRKIGEVGENLDLFHSKVDEVKKQSEPSFAVLEVGAQQFKVTLGDTIYTEKLHNVEVNDIVKFGRVLMVGTKHDTTIGRPYISEASIVALVEEQFKDGKVFVFKKKRRKNYRRFNTHRQNLSRIKILCLNSDLAHKLEG